MSKLIVDSGSTKTTWLLLPDHSPSVSIETMGINPVRDDGATIRSLVSEAVTLLGAKGITYRDFLSDSLEVYFYGAGCIPPYSNAVHGALKEAFPNLRNALVESDLLGAARALCQHEEGIACILGTGANSCLYDGRSIVQQTPALGWILGDEGSGAVLGRRLVGDVLKRQLPETLCTAFLERFQLTQADIIERVYRQPQPNRFLASLVPFLTEHIEEAAIQAFLVKEFRRFLCRNVVAYGRRDLPISFVGGVASQFTTQLREALDAEGFQLGNVMRNPIEGMARFHA